MVLVDVAVFALSAGALWIGAKWVVEAAATLAARAGVSPLVIGLTVVAFGTSAPEFAVTIDAALAGESDVSVGNVVGSNLFNLGVVLGGIALVAPIRVDEPLVRRDAVAMGVATALALVVLANLWVSRLEGALLSAVLLVYLTGLALDARRSASDRTEGSASTAADALVGPTRPQADRVRELLALAVGLGLVVGGGHLLVATASDLARAAGVSPWVVGVTVVAFGTSLPEVATSVAAVRTGAVAIAAGNVVGSNVFNLLGVLGITAVVQPLAADSAALAGLVVLGGLTAITTVTLASGRRLNRLEGALLAGVVLGYWVVTVGGA
ncbi:calcium/sodium antiporter [Natronobiforma cellulositropha]|uniref:calcium/sodium antiporter n=1 Tax=Natronobiforma cellulositropha TaxID=1679076 RepID=UPI0021D5B91F|nr:calcium/sodium antiporter [Natronobiforma cellulositropha]